MHTHNALQQINAPFPATLINSFSINCEIYYLSCWLLLVLDKSFELSVISMYNNLII